MKKPPKSLRCLPLITHFILLVNNRHTSGKSHPLYIYTIGGKRLSGQRRWYPRTPIVGKTVEVALVQSLSVSGGTDKAVVFQLLNIFSESSVVTVKLRRPFRFRQADIVAVGALDDSVRRLLRILGFQVKVKPLLAEA